MNMKVMHERQESGVKVELVELLPAHEFFIRVYDLREYEGFETVATSDGKLAMDMFRHPFAYRLNTAA